MEIQLTRRALLKAGLSAAFLSLVPDIAFADEFSLEEKGVIGQGSFPDSIYKPDETGNVDAETLIALTMFTKWAIAAWGFKDATWDERKDISEYPGRLESVVSQKTNNKPSYLAEYKSAAGLIVGAKGHLGSEHAAFCHLMFAGRDKGSDLRAPRLIRARRFVFDEFTRHILSNGGFRTLGLVNFEGYMGGTLYDPKSFRGSMA